MNTPSEREASAVESALEGGRDAASRVAAGSDSSDDRDGARTSELPAPELAAATELSLTESEELAAPEDPSEQVADQELVMDAPEPTEPVTSLSGSDDEVTVTSLNGIDEVTMTSLNGIDEVTVTSLNGTDVEAPPDEAPSAAYAEREAAPLNEADRSSEAFEAETPPTAAGASEADPDGELPPERLTLPDSIIAKRKDEPLPSFDIPDLESVPVEPAPSFEATSLVGVPARAAFGAQPTGSSKRSEPPPMTVPDEVELPPLNELTEDEEDAVTSIEVQDSEVRDLTPASSSFEPLPAFAPEVPPAVVAASVGQFPRLDHRKAATVLIRRADVPERPAPAPVPSAPPKPSWLSNAVGWLQRRRLPRWEWAPDRMSVKRAGRFLDSIVPELSLVLFGSGIGAGTVLYVMQRREPAAEVQSQSVQPLRGEPARTAGSASAKPDSREAPQTLTERARLGDRDALASIARLAAEERSSALTLAQEEGEGVRSAQEFQAFIAGLRSGSTPAAGVVNQFVEFATNPSTMFDTFAELTQWPGSQGPDLIYAVWENAPGGNRAGSLARNLLYTADQRAKASPALEAALELREGKACEDYARALPRVLEQGDVRSLSMLVALKHEDGCGDDRAQDCYPCLRSDTSLDDAIAVVKQRPGPRF